MNTRKLYEKYKNVISYLFFGVCTTLVNVLIYWIAAHSLRLSVMMSTIIAWLLAVLFAYITNRKWVFHSEAREKKEMVKEICSFFACRLATGLLDWVWMFIFVDILKCNDVMIKFISNVVVIVFNYVASRIIIFGKGK